ncbi:MAG: hypothetical protein ACE5LD_01760 [Candidatus Bipolaricaulia bacterium]
MASALGELPTHHGDATGWNNARKIVVDHDGAVHIVYQLSLAPGQERDLFVWARSENGRPWETVSYEGRWPAIGIDPEANVIYITFVRRKAEGDELWLYWISQSSRGERLIASAAPHSLFYPAIAVAGGHVHLAWEAHRGRMSYIEYAKLGPSGEPLIETVAQNAPGLYFPSLAVGPDGPHLAWEEAIGPRRHRIVHGKRGPDGWEAGPVSGPELNARYPALDYDPERDRYDLVFVNYATAGNAIYYRAFSSASWSGLERLSRGLEGGYWTFPTIEDGNVVWGRQVSAGCPVGPLWYLSLDSCSEPQVLEGEFAAFPHLFRRGDTLHLIWTDRDPEDPLLRLVRYRQLNTSSCRPQA